VPAPEIFNEINEPDASSGRAPAVDTRGGYGRKSITEGRADVILQLSNLQSLSLPTLSN
jgi:hypothetical protein